MKQRLFIVFLPSEVDNKPPTPPLDANQTLEMFQTAEARHPEYEDLYFTSCGLVMTHSKDGVVLFGEMLYPNAYSDLNAFLYDVASRGIWVYEIKQDTSLYRRTLWKAQRIHAAQRRKGRRDTTFRFSLEYALSLYDGTMFVERPREEEYLDSRLTLSTVGTCATTLAWMLNKPNYRYYTLPNLIDEILTKDSHNLIQRHSPEGVFLDERNLHRFQR